STAIVLNSLATPPAASISRHTNWPRSFRCTCPGTNWVNELATAMMGLSKSSVFIPVARHKARAPAILRPWVEVFERYVGMADPVHQEVRKKRGLPWQQGQSRGLDGGAGRKHCCGWFLIVSGQAYQSWVRFFISGSPAMFDQPTKMADRPSSPPGTCYLFLYRPGGSARQAVDEIQDVHVETRVAWLVKM